MKAPWYKSRWFTVVLHIAFWSLLFSLPYLLKPSFQGPRPEGPRRPPQDIGYLFNLLKGIFLMGVFYLNAYILVPRFFFKKSYWQYGLALLGTLIMFSCLEIAYFNL